MELDLLNFYYNEIIINNNTTTKIIKDFNEFKEKNTKKIFLI
jgi:hypothetical protein